MTDIPCVKINTITERFFGPGEYDSETVCGVKNIRALKKEVNALIDDIGRKYKDDSSPEDFFSSAGVIQYTDGTIKMTDTLEIKMWEDPDDPDHDDISLEIRGLGFDFRISREMDREDVLHAAANRTR